MHIILMQYLNKNFVARAYVEPALNTELQCKLRKLDDDIYFNLQLRKKAYL